MTKEQLFQGVFEQMLDYGDSALLERCAKWGLNIYELLEKNKRILSTMDTHDESVFIYAAGTAVIVGEFGNRAFGDHNLFDGHELDLASLELPLDDIRGYMDGYPDIEQTHFEKLSSGNYVNLDDIKGTVLEYQEEIYKGLMEIYKLQGQTDSADATRLIYESLINIFEEQDTETKEVLTPSMSASNELSAYSYVEQGFQY